VNNPLLPWENLAILPEAFLDVKLFYGQSLGNNLKEPCNGKRDYSITRKKSVLFLDIPFSGRKKA
jgi:hypothetical protein